MANKTFGYLVSLIVGKKKKEEIREFLRYVDEKYSSCCLHNTSMYNINTRISAKRSLLSDKV